MNVGCEAVALVIPSTTVSDVNVGRTTAVGVLAVNVSAPCVAAVKLSVPCVNVSGVQLKTKFSESFGTVALQEAAVCWSVPWVNEPPLNEPLVNDAAEPAVTEPSVSKTLTEVVDGVTVIVGVLTVPSGV